MLRDIAKGKEDVAAVIAILAEVAPDVIALQGIDYDLENRAVLALIAALAEAGLELPHFVALRPNTGLPTGLDLNKNGRLGDGADAQGYGRFAGQSGMALLSAYPLELVADHSAQLWAELPWASFPSEYFGRKEAEALRLSHTGHWEVDVLTPSGRVRVLTWSAGAPVFDGPEDRDGLRNRDELRFWEHRLAEVDGPFVLMGKSNLDPLDGDGLTEAMADLLSNPGLQDPRPKSAGGALAPGTGHKGDPALDTVDWPEDGPGNLRVSYVLPWAGAVVTGAGVFWPAPGTSDLLGEEGDAAGPHRLVWVDIDF